MSFLALREFTLYVAEKDLASGKILRLLKGIEYTYEVEVNKPADIKRGDPKTVLKTTKITKTAGPFRAAPEFRINIAPGFERFRNDVLRKRQFPKAFSPEDYME